MELTQLIPLILLTLALSAFFSGLEIAFVSSSKLRIELDREKGSLTGRILSGFQQNAPRFITTLLIGNNIALVIFGALIAMLLEKHWLHLDGDSFGGLMIETLVATVVVLIFGEFFPKAFFRLAPFQILSFFALPLKALHTILTPLSMLFTRLSHGLIRVIMGERYQRDLEEFSVIDLEHYIKELSSGGDDDTVDEELNADFFEKALYLKDIKVRECMVPRTEVEAIDVTDSIDELRELFLETKHSRILIYRDTIDEVLGYTHHFELFKQPASIRDILIDIPTVPESMTARDLLTKLTKEHKSLAWVVDEYGGTAGLVTLEDLIEEIFGEIRDEHDDEAFIEKQLDDNTFVFSGRLEVDHINETYELGIPEGEYETLSGFIVVTHEDIPDEGETVHFDRFDIKILSAEDNRIGTVQVTVTDDED